MGIEGIAHCSAVAIVSPFLVEYILEPWKGRVRLKTLAFVSCAGKFWSLILLAAIRGNRMAEETRSEAARLLSLTASRFSPLRAETTFYEKTIPLLQLMMILARNCNGDRCRLRSTRSLAIPTNNTTSLNNASHLSTCAYERSSLKEALRKSFELPFDTWDHRNRMAWCQSCWTLYTFHRSSRALPPTIPPNK